MEISRDIYRLAKELGVKDLSLPKLVVGNNVLDLIGPYVQENGFNHIALVVDENTYKAAGRQLYQILVEIGVKVNVVILEGNQYGQVVADEPTVVQLLVETPQDTDVFLAVGSGTIHDITRFCGKKMDIPFISIPTAASVDGFTSKGAPLIIKGVKRTIQTASPIALFADIEILKRAPREMTAAGFGDIIGKYTSLLDWKVSELVGQEPYNELAASMTRKALDKTVEYTEKIAAGDDDGIEVLTHSLIESGLVMLLLNFSRPASGGEHHLSHYWEMDLLDRDAKQLLHGAKVGVATTIIIDLYREFLPKINKEHIDNEQHRERIATYWNEIIEMIDKLPSSDKVKDMLRRVDGPATTDELGINNELVVKSINEAFRLRDRCTGLLLINQAKTKKDEILTMVQPHP